MNFWVMERCGVLRVEMMFWSDMRSGGFCWLSSSGD